MQTSIMNERQKEEDKRTEQEQKADFDKGMQSGVEVVKTEGKTSEELAAEVKAKKQKYELAIPKGECLGDIQASEPRQRPLILG